MTYDVEEGMLVVRAYNPSLYVNNNKKLGNSNQMSEK